MDGRRATELVTQVERCLQQGLVEDPGKGAELWPRVVVGRAEVAGLVGNEALACVTATALLEVAFGEYALAIVVAQHAVGVGNHLPPAVVIA
ncbi:hypothetical protein D3C76_1233480 [compost metagenome]